MTGSGIEAVLLDGGHVLSDDGAGVVQTDVLLRGTKIELVEKEIDARRADVLIDASNWLLIPGLVNAHTHAHNNLGRGVADNWSLEVAILALASWPEFAPEDLYVVACIGAAEMARTGTTAAFDLVRVGPSATPEHVHAVASAYGDVGLRAVVAPAVSDIPMARALGASVPEAETAGTAGDAIALTASAIEGWNWKVPDLVSIGIAPTIPLLCSDQLLLACRDLQQRNGAPIHTHLAESKLQAVEARKRWGSSVVAALEGLGLLNAQFVGAHGVWLEPSDYDLLAQAGSVVVHNPASNLKLGNGIAPIRELLDAGTIVALGTDGVMTSDNLVMFEAMRFGALVAKIRGSPGSHSVGSAEVWEMATLGGAHALGARGRIGALRPGHEADLVGLRLDSSTLIPGLNLRQSLVYAETGSSVDMVMVAGRFVVRQGTVLNVDEGRLRHQAQGLAERIRSSVAHESISHLEAFIAPYLQAALRAPFPATRSVERQ